LNPVANEETPTPTTEAEFAANLAAAQEFADNETPEASLLLTKPLDATKGGFYHFGKSLYYQSDVFETASDLGYTNLRNWIDGGTASVDCSPTTEIGP